MKTLVLVTTMLLFCFVLKGQEIKSDSTYYCEIVGMAKFMSTKMTIQIDFGEKKQVVWDNRYKDPTTGKHYVFNSMVDALNFMGKDGWEFVQAYAVTYGQTSSVYHYLLKKK